VVEPSPSRSASDLDQTLPDLRFEPSAPDDDEAEDMATGAAAAAPAARGFVNPWGRVVPVRPNVAGFVDKNWPAAEALAKQLPGATPEQMLAALGSENNYGDNWMAKQKGNYGGIHFDPSRGRAGYFPGQTGVFNTQGVYDSKVGKFVGAQPMAEFPPDKGFQLSGQVLVNRIKPYVPSGGITDPKQFFELIHEHGRWGDRNLAYIDNLYGRYGSYWLIKAASEARKKKP
jgi:hypothetical protein